MSDINHLQSTVDELVVFLRENMVTRDDLSEAISGLRGELKGDMAGLKSELKGEMAAMEHRLLDRMDTLAIKTEEKAREYTQTYFDEKMRMMNK